MISVDEDDGKHDGEQGLINLANLAKKNYFLRSYMNVELKEMHIYIIGEALNSTGLATCPPLENM